MHTKLSFLVNKTLTKSFYDITGWDDTYRNEFDNFLREESREVSVHLRKHVLE
jgi:hypothetical protein